MSENVLLPSSPLRKPSHPVGTKGPKSRGHNSGRSQHFGNLSPPPHWLPFQWTFPLLHPHQYPIPRPPPACSPRPPTNPVGAQYRERFPPPSPITQDAFRGDVKPLRGLRWGRPGGHPLPHQEKNLPCCGFIVLCCFPPYDVPREPLSSFLFRCVPGPLKFLFVFPCPYRNLSPKPVYIT